jgi:hypothetical protein
MSSSYVWPEEYSLKAGWMNPNTAVDKLIPAFIAAQGQIEGASKDKKNDHFRSKYADLGAVWVACRDALQANGIGVLQWPTSAPSGSIGLRTTLVHMSGQSMQDTFYMPLKDATNSQAAGSALTYARRYALSAIMGICPVDDDGNAASAAPRASKGPAQAPAKDWTVDIINTRNNFLGAKTKEIKKEIFMSVRGSEMPEPEKTNLLTEFGAAIKGMKDK